MRSLENKIPKRIQKKNIRNMRIVSCITMVILPLFSIFVFWGQRPFDYILKYMAVIAIFEMFLFLSYKYSQRVLKAINISKKAKKYVYVFWTLYITFIMAFTMITPDSVINFPMLTATFIIVSMSPYFNSFEYFSYVLYMVFWLLCLCIMGTQTKAYLTQAILVFGVCGIFSRVYYTKKIKYLFVKRRYDDSARDAYTDPLTMLNNRRGFAKSIKTIWPFCVRNKCKVALMIMDIDNFKIYNDTFGHPAGDECLKKVSSVIKDNAKRATDITARLGGEEFIIFFQGAKDADIVAYAEKMRKNIENLKIKHGSNSDKRYVTVSIGVVIMEPTNTLNFDLIYEMADKLLYRAKNNGRNRVEYCIYSHANGQRMA